MCTGVHVKFIATLYVNPEQATWPLDEVPRITAAALNPIPDYEAQHSIELLRVDHSGGRETYSALTAKDKKLITKQCKTLGLPSLLEFTRCEEIGQYLEVFNTAPSRPEWMLGYIPPPDPFHVQRVTRFVDATSHAKALEEAIRRGEIVQRLSNGTVLDGHIKIQGAVLARHDLEKFCASLLIDVRDKDDRPRFTIPVRPMEVPPALLALPPQTQVIYIRGPRPGVNSGSNGTSTAAALVDEFASIIERQQGQGRFKLSELVQILVEANDKHAKPLMEAVRNAVAKQRLTVYSNRTGAPCEASDELDWSFDYVTTPDIAKWLNGEPKVHLVFPMPGQTQQVKPDPVEAALDEQEAAAQVLRDVNDGWVSLFVLLGMVADSRGLKGEARKVTDKAIYDAVWSKKIPIYSRSARLSAINIDSLKEISADHIVKVDDVYRWAEANSPWPLGDLKLPGLDFVFSSSGARTASQLSHRTEAAKPVAAQGQQRAEAIRTTIHRAKGGRAHWLDAAFGIARERAANPNDKLNVWFTLCELARSQKPPAPLVGMVGKAIKRQDGAGHKLFDADAFAKYWKRRSPPETVA